MTKGIYVRPTGRAPEIQKITHYADGYIETDNIDFSLCYIAEKTDGTKSYFVRYHKTLIDPSQNEKITGNFLCVDEEIYKLYKSFLEAGHFAGFTEAGKLIRMRGFA